MSDELLKQYKELPENIKNNLDDLLVYKTCYDRDDNISDEMVLLITSVSHNCWLEDEYSKASKDYYASYLLDAVYEHGITKEQIEDLEYPDIVGAFNNDEEVTNLFKFDVSKYEYWLTTIDYLEYYYADDGFYIVNEDGLKIKEPHPMENINDEIFGVLKEKEILSMPFSTHYNIRNIIKNDIMGDKELEERYKEGINNYKKFCKDKNILSRDILYVVSSDENIDLTEEDIFYSDTAKLLRLENVLKELGTKDVNNYEYVASFSNGTDYYCNNKDNKYLAIDNNNVIKYFEDNEIFLLNELKEIDKIIYIKPFESYKIIRQLKDPCFHLKIANNEQLLKSINKFVKYNRRKDVKFLNANENCWDIASIYRESMKLENKRKRELARKMKERNVEKIGKITTNNSEVDKREKVYIDKKTGKEL